MHVANLARAPKRNTGHDTLCALRNVRTELKPAVSSPVPRPRQGATGRYHNIRLEFSCIVRIFYTVEVSRSRCCN